MFKPISVILVIGILIKMWNVTGSKGVPGSQDFGHKVYASIEFQLIIHEVLSE